MIKKSFYIGFICLILGVTTLSASACHFKIFKNKQSADKVEQKVTQTLVSKDFEILPTMNSLSNSKNQVWVGTFQLIWNDLVNELIKQPVEFIASKSIMAENLNKQGFTTSDISESAYYKKWGLASPKLKAEIERDIKKKFDEKSDILDQFNWAPEPKKYFLYAMLKKDFQYIEPFDKLADDRFEGSEELYKYFGVNKNTKSEVKDTVKVLFYNNPKDYAVSLKSKTGDIVYLYKTDDDKTLDLYYEDMKNKSESFTGEKYLKSRDEFKAPMLDFKSETDFEELCNKQIRNTDLMISKAVETIKFKMDEAGVKLKSEAGMMIMLTSLAPEIEAPRYFYFNGKYVIFLEESGKKPYFAMKISDMKNLQN